MSDGWGRPSRLNDVLPHPYLHMNPVPSITVRRATVEDLESLVTFNASLAWETEQRRLDAERLRSGVRALLQDHGKGWYAVAEADSSTEPVKIVGQVLVTFEWSDWRNGHFWWLQSVYVIPDYRRMGIFTHLYHYVQEEAKKQRERICGFRLYVEQENRGAHQTYARIGFQGTPYHMYELELP